MRRIFIFFIVQMLAVPLFAGGWYSVNIDLKTTAAMTAAYAAEAATEVMNDEDVQKILDHYTSAEVATAGIFASKWLDRKALQNAGLFSDAEENFYYKRIYVMVSAQIMPKILDVAALLIKYPDKAIYWGPYLFRVCEQTKQLCMTFETVVANGKVSFQDVAFLAINDNLKGLFDLTKLGEVDWAAVWDHLADFGDGLTKEDLEEDLERLMTAGGAIASAGGAVLDSVWTNASRVGGVFHSKPGEILQLYHDFKDMYETFSDPSNIKDLLMEQILSTDSTGVANLFTLDGYNITSYISDNLQEMQGRFYTQRWYIYWRDSGSEQVCSYAPPTDSESIMYGGEWYRVGTSDEHYQYTTADYENSLRNSESYAGWSRARCQELNSNGDKFQYQFYNYLTSSRIYKKNSGRTTAFSYAHYIDVYKTWNVYEEVYEEVFDSQYDNENAMQAKFNAKLAELNDNEEGRVYRIGKDSKIYYQAADEVRMRGCSTVSFTVECHDHASLGEGNFSWKENGDQRHALDENSKRYAMESTLSGGADTSELDEGISTWGGEVTRLQEQIRALQQQNDELLAQISQASIEEAAALRAQYNANRNEISRLEAEKSRAQTELNKYLNARQEMIDDYADERDGTYRIPAVMHEIETAYHIIWTDAGSWQGWTFVRHGNVPNISGEVEFRADLSKERGESHFLGIRYHRAILAVHWTLSANYSSSQIADIMQLDPELSDEEKAAKVNDRMRELREEFPNCSVEANYAYSSPAETEGDEDAIHLLWTCDRLAIARDVDYRLSKIYAQLVLIEKFMRSRETLLDYLKRDLGLAVLGGSDRIRIGGRSFRHWRNVASAVARGDYIVDDDEE